MPEEADEQLSLAANERSVRIELEELDALMNLVGELSLVEANLGRIRELAQRGQLDKQDQRDYREHLRVMKRRLGLLQDRLLGVRMSPLDSLFLRLRANFERLGRRLQREVELVYTGGETQLDAELSEGLSVVLFQMLSELARHHEGEGRVYAELRARREGTRVVVELFHPATDGPLFWSVRSADVVPDPVMESIAEQVGMMSGLVDVDFQPRRGERVKITVPVTRAILQALVVEVSGHTFCVPLNSVIESLMISPDQLQSVEGHEVVIVRGRTLPLIYLARAFGLERTVPRAIDNRGSFERLYVVIIGLAEHRLGLVVDELLGQQDVVIRHIGRALQQIPGIAGATELGDERTVLLLDVGTLVGEAVGRGTMRSSLGLS